MTASGLVARNVVVRSGRHALVDGVDLTVPLGRTLGLVGESGSGKSLLAQALLGVLPDGLSCSADELTWTIGEETIDLRTAESSIRRGVLGRTFGLSWQQPLTALNPVLGIGAQLEEALRVAGARGDLREHVARRLEAVGLPDAEAVARRLPHELSGGMVQRAMMALSLAGDPSFLVADEPTAALDPSTRAHLLDALRREREQRGLTMLVISHDLELVGDVCDSVLVMYAGRIVERAPSDALLDSPLHPYTIGLARAGDGRVGGRFFGIDGSIPPPGARPTGCRFRDRCPFAAPDCAASEPELFDAGDERKVACPVALSDGPLRGQWPREGGA